MYNVSELFNNAAFSKSRKVLLKVIFNGLPYEIDGEFLKKITIDETLTANSNLSMGDACANKAVIEMYMPKQDIAFSDGYFQVYAGLETGKTREYCPMGKYYVSDVETSDNYKTVTITGYDIFNKMDVPYEPKNGLGESATVAQIIEDIALQNGGLEIAETIFPDMNVNIVNCTQREMIGYIAGLMGSNANINREGKLEFKWYEKQKFSITPDVQYMDGFKHTSQEIFVLGSLRSGIEETVYEAGSGQGISFYNPFINQEILNEIYERTGQQSFVPCEIRYRGNPAVECGDIITAIDKDGEENDVAVMTQTIELSGGIGSTIYSYGNFETETVMGESPTEKKLNKLYKTITESFKEATELIKGTKGGYFELKMGEEGFPEGWEVRDTPKLTPTTRLWRMTKAGLIFSEDGGRTVSKTAITMDGRIIADAVIAGKIATSQIEVYGGKEGEEGKSLDDFFRVKPDENTGELYLELGSADNTIVLRQENDRISFCDGKSGNELAFFSNSAFEIVQLDRFRIGNFAFIPRVTGNLSLTKVV